MPQLSYVYDFLSVIEKCIPGLSTFPVTVADAIEHELQLRTHSQHHDALPLPTPLPLPTAANYGRSPRIEVRNRVWSCESDDNIVDLNAIMADHRSLRVGQNDLIQLRWRAKKCVRVLHRDMYEWHWLSASRRYTGGLLLDFHCSITGRKTHAKIYHRSRTVQLFGAGNYPEHALAALRCLQQVLGQLSPAFSTLARSRKVEMAHMRCINENSAFQLFRTVHLEDTVHLSAAFIRDWRAIRAMERITMFSFVDEIRARDNCIYIGITDGKAGHAMITLFYRTGRGHISTRTSACRIIAWCVLICLMNIYWESFTDSFELASSSSSSTTRAEAEATFSSIPLALGKRKRSTISAAGT